MPKGKKKGKHEHRRTEVYSSDEDAGIDMTIDNCSETSGQSDLKSNHDDAESDLEKFEEKVLEVVDGLTARSAQARVTAMASLRAALSRRPVGTLLSGHRETLADHVVRALRRGRDSEKKAAAGLVPVLALQIGDEGLEEFVQVVRPALTFSIVDTSASLDTRCESCLALSVLCYLLEDDVTEILEVMRVYETIFSGSYLKGDGSVKVLEEPALGAWHAGALDAWALLLGALPPAPAAAALQRAQLLDLLHAHATDVRVSAGAALAVAHVALRAAGAHEQAEALGARALPALQALARDSHKYRARRDRKLQRASARDLLKYFEEDWEPEGVVRVGREAAEWAGWARAAAAEALAAALGTALAALAPAARPLRLALRLPPEPPAPRPAQRHDKLTRQLQNMAACKARTLARNKSRDKRSAALAL